MKIVKFTANFEVRDDAIEELKKVEHHAEYLLDLDRWPEILSVSGVKVELQGIKNVPHTWMDGCEYCKQYASCGKSVHECRSCKDK